MYYFKQIKHYLMRIRKVGNKMSTFSNNLLFYRKKNNLTQENLAEKLEVSRQTISKWEADTTYPEMDKIMQLCDLFSCDMDTLLRGEAQDVDIEENEKYDKQCRKMKRSVATGVGLILLGVSVMLFLIGIGFKEIYSAAIMLSMVVIAIMLLISSGIEFEHFKKKHPQIVPFYTEAEEDRMTQIFIRKIAGGIGLILVGVIGIVIFSEIGEPGIFFVVSAFMLVIAVSVTLFITAGMDQARMNIKEYNREFSPDPEVKEKENKVGKWSSVIMISATIIFLISGLVYGLWYINWIVFPVGGLISGIVSIIIKGQDS